MSTGTARVAKAYDVRKHYLVPIASSGWKRFKTLSTKLFQTNCI
jgi:hypothetical protein